jgi:DNA-binding CsgD family transcriptional regulator/tetratricopeptide (TPR) repeat protein
MELVERGEQLRDLLKTFELARMGRGRTVLVSGEAGIGKTSLLRSFIAALGDRARVLLGACDDLSTPRTLGPFRDMARHHPQEIGALDADRDTLIDTLLELMSFSMRPAVVVIDDAHWADEASLDVIRYLTRRMSRLPAVLALSYRDDDLAATHPLRRITGALNQADATRIPLGRLSSETVARIASGAGLDPRQVVSLVGGNPFYLAEVLASPGPGVPPSVRDAVLSRLAQLPDQARDLLEVLSVVPGGAEPELAALLAGGSAEPFDAARRKGVLDQAGAQVRFRHELARRAVAESLPHARQVECHRLVLDALLSLDADPSRVVHHAVDARAEGVLATFAPAAAWAALEARSYREAASFALLALRHYGDNDPAERARLHGCAARALFALNRFGEAAEQADLAVAAWDDLGAQPVELGEALLISARLSTAVADPTAARMKAERALEVLEPLGPTRELALCYATLGSQDALHAEFRSAIERCDAAIELADSLALPDVRARAMGYRGIARLPLGDEDGFADMRASVEIAQQIDHGDYLTGAAHNLSVALIRSGRHAEAPPYLDIAARAAREHGLDRASFHVEGQQCHVLLLTGKWDEAERRLRRILDTEGDPGSTAVAPLAYLGRILARRGDPQAIRLIDQAWSVAESSGEDQKQATAGGPRIELAWLQGDEAEVRRLGWWFVDLAIDVHHTYLRAEALRYLKRIGEKVAPFDGCLPPFAAGLAGDWATAADLWEKANNPYERALELVESPDRAAAFDGLRTLDRLGAVATAERVRQQLRVRGVRGVPRGPRHSTRARPGNLTMRQTEILGLVADGLTNAEIADRLVVSKRTIDNHLTAILAQLDVASRQAAVESARRVGALDAAKRAAGQGRSTHVPESATTE